MRRPACSIMRRTRSGRATLGRQKERKKTETQGRDGRTARRHHTGILRRGVWCASRRPPLGVRLFLSLFAVSRRFSLQPSCHLAVVPHSRRSLCCPVVLCLIALLCLVLRRRRRLPIPPTPAPTPLLSASPASRLSAQPAPQLPLLAILAPRVYLTPTPNK